ncbi:hypothetical protein GCM10011351_13380 [Paraliobacillus quinghaiensis]|uniref:RNA polymerase sigma factor n=1 Tax=Paraliobacillus quinghaiensis TaxID=470815 RepID=A0A917WU23_9BACI|nr:RNA polymerase sigma factor [Paraliobacillus quinghaiensis]GGM28716.1 hypothetical protein GCM10011351_13380 [Paraliobacillus quinghaiensis]
MKDDIFSEIYITYFPYVYRYLYGLTYHNQIAEDLTQDTFIKAFSILQAPNENIKSWLLVVAHNHYVDYVKKNRRLVFREESLFDRIKTKDFTDQLILNESTGSAFGLIKRLPEKQRQVILLCLVNEVSYQQAGVILGISVSAVTNLIYRARKTLRDLRRQTDEQ